MHALIGYYFIKLILNLAENFPFHFIYLWQFDDVVQSHASHVGHCTVMLIFPHHYITGGPFPL